MSNNCCEKKELLKSLLPDNSWYLAYRIPIFKGFYKK